MFALAPVAAGKGCEGALTTGAVAAVVTVAGVVPLVMPGEDVAPLAIGVDVCDCGCALAVWAARSRCSRFALAMYAWSAIDGAGADAPA